MTVEGLAGERHRAQHGAQGQQSDDGRQDDAEQGAVAEEQKHEHDQQSDRRQAARIAIDVGAEVAHQGPLAGHLQHVARSQRRLFGQGHDLMVEPLGVVGVEQLDRDQGASAVLADQAADVERHIHHRSTHVGGGRRVLDRTFDEGLDAQAVRRRHEALLGREAHDPIRVDAGQLGDLLAQPGDQVQALRREDPLRSVIDHGDQEGILEAEDLLHALAVFDGRVPLRQERFRAGVLLELKGEKRHEQQRRQHGDERAQRSRRHQPEKPQRKCSRHGPRVAYGELRGDLTEGLLNER